MHKTLRSIFPALLALLIIGIAFLLFYFGIRGIWRIIIGINAQLAVAVVAAATTLTVSTITVMLGRYYERKKEIDYHFRADKIKIYDEFLTELFKVFHSKGESAENTVEILKEWQRKIVLWGGSNVLVAYFKWMNSLKSTPNAQTIFLMDEFFRALRADIGQNSNGIEKGAFSNLVLKHGDFFLHQAKINPNITLAELDELEKKTFDEE